MKTGVAEAIQGSRQAMINFGKAYKKYYLLSARRDGFSIFHPYFHMEINKDVKDIAIQTPFSYFDVLPLYERLGKNKERTLRAVNICITRNLPLHTYIYSPLDYSFKL